MITVGIPPGGIGRIYARVERAATINCRYCVPEENDVPVYVVTNPRTPLRELWPQTQHYD